MKKIFLWQALMVALCADGMALHAKDKPVAVHRATWETSVAGLTLIIDARELITPEQREIVNSGFSTFTLLGVSERQLRTEDAPIDMRLICRVKYDTWEEKYHTTKIEPLPVGDFSGTSLQSWSNECLRYRVVNPALLRELKNGGNLYAILQVRQSSPDEATKIKNWLVKQQSGFMQGLYAHMLGDLQIGGRTEILIEVPPAPSGPNTKKQKSSSK